MQKLLTCLLCLAMLVAAGAAFGQFDERYRDGTYPEGPSPTEAFLDSGVGWYHPDRSGLGVFNKMDVGVRDVVWSGEGPATIPFTINQRGPRHGSGLPHGFQ